MGWTVTDGNIQSGFFQIQTEFQQGTKLLDKQLTLAATAMIEPKAKKDEKL